MKTTKTFGKLVNALRTGARFVDSCGGTRSGKTYSALQLLTILALADKKPTITSVVSRALPHLKQGAIRDFKMILNNEGQWDENRWNATECFYTFPNKSIIEFFGTESVGKVFGPARDRLFLNEGNFITWEAARQLITRTRGLTIYDYNPSSPFWGTDDLYNLCNEEGIKIEKVHSTYLDNQFLTPEQVKFIEANRVFKNWWRVYGLGLMGQIEGQVFDFKIIDEMPDKEGFVESYGMDFGFTNDPTTLIRTLIHRGKREIYADQRLWETGMKNPQIADALRAEGIQRDGYGPKVYADCAEPKSIAEIRDYDLNITGCDKSAKIVEQIQHLQMYTIYVTRRSTELIVEGRKYLYKQRADGTFTNEPIEYFNHGIDALRYAVFSDFTNSNTGVYNIRF